MREILVVGSMAYDAVETWAGKRERALGGSATYFAIAASLFARPHIVAVVGRDFAVSDLQRLQRRGIGIDGVEQVDGETFRWGGRYSRYFETRETLFTELNVFAGFRPTVPPARRKPDVLFLANIHPRLQGDVLDAVERPAFVALDTMNFWIQGEHEHLRAVLRRVDLLMLNDEEAFALSGSGNMLQAAEAILGMGPRALVIKRGEHGAWLFTEGLRRLVPAVPVRDVIDPTGAGDSFAGGFIGWLAAHGSYDDRALEQAMVAGTVVASCTVEGFSVDALERASFADLESRRQRLAEVVSTLSEPLHDAREINA